MLKFNYDIHTIIYEYLGKGFHIFRYCSSTCKKYVDKYIANNSKENISYINYFMDNVEQFNWLESVCNFNFDQKNRIIPMRNILSTIAAKNNNLELLKEICRKGYPVDHYTSSCASEVGNLDMVRFLHENDCEIGYHAFLNAALNCHMDLLEYLFSYNLHMCIEYTSICSQVAKNGNIDLFMYFYRRGYLFDSDAIKNAAGNGHMDIILYIRDNYGDIFEYSKMDVEICAAASSGGHLECLSFLYNNDFSIDRKVSRYAALNGHKHILEFAYDNLIIWDEKACANASRNGHLDCLTYLHEKNCPLSARAYAYAARNGHYHIIKYLYEIGCPYDIYACKNAAAGGHLNILKYFRRKKFPWDEQTCSNAVSICNFEILKYAHEHGCQWSSDTFLQAVICENINRNNPIILDKIDPIITYLYVNMCPLHNRMNIFLELYDCMCYNQYNCDDDFELYIDYDSEGENIYMIYIDSDLDQITDYEDIEDEYDVSDMYVNTYDNEDKNIFEIAMEYEEKYYR